MSPQKRSPAGELETDENIILMDSRRDFLRFFFLTGAALRRCKDSCGVEDGAGAEASQEEVCANVVDCLDGNLRGKKEAFESTVLATERGRIYNCEKSFHRKNYQGVHESLTL